MTLRLLALCCCFHLSVGILPGACKPIKNNSPGPKFHNTACGLAIKALPANDRPKPEEYFPKASIDAHVKPFKDDGVAFFVLAEKAKEFIMDPSFPKNYLADGFDGMNAGYSGLQWVAPYPAQAKLVKRAVNGKKAWKYVKGEDAIEEELQAIVTHSIEKPLGVTAGDWTKKGSTLLLCVWRPDKHKRTLDSVRIPTGNEPGTWEEKWQPGGYAGEGDKWTPEAIIDGKDTELTYLKYFVVFDNGDIVAKMEGEGDQEKLVMKEIHPAEIQGIDVEQGYVDQADINEVASYIGTIKPDDRKQAFARMKDRTHSALALDDKENGKRIVVPLHAPDKLVLAKADPKMVNYKPDHSVQDEEAAAPVEEAKAHREKANKYSRYMAKAIFDDDDDRYFHDQDQNQNANAHAHFYGEYQGEYQGNGQMARGIGGQYGYTQYDGSAEVLRTLLIVLSCIVFGCIALACSLCTCAAGCAGGIFIKQKQKEMEVWAGCADEQV